MPDIHYYDARTYDETGPIITAIEARRETAIVRYHWYPSGLSVEGCTWQAYVAGEPWGTHATELEARFAVLEHAAPPAAAPLTEESTDD